MSIIVKHLLHFLNSHNRETSFQKNYYKTWLSVFAVGNTGPVIRSHDNITIVHRAMLLVEVVYHFDFFHSWNLR